MDKTFVPDHILLKLIALLDKCKCDLCQLEKSKKEEMLSNNGNLQQNGVLKRRI